MLIVKLGCFFHVFSWKLVCFQDRVISRLNCFHFHSTFILYLTHKLRMKWFKQENSITREKFNSGIVSAYLESPDLAGAHRSLRFIPALNQNPGSDVSDLELKAVWMQQEAPGNNIIIIMVFRICFNNMLICHTEMTYKTGPYSPIPIVMRFSSFFAYF